MAQGPATTVSTAAPASSPYAITPTGWGGSASAVWPWPEPWSDRTK